MYCGWQVRLERCGRVAVDGVTLGRNHSLDLVLRDTKRLEVTGRLDCPACLASQPPARLAFSVRGGGAAVWRGVRGGQVALSLQTQGVAHVSLVDSVLNTLADSAIQVWAARSLVILRCQFPLAAQQAVSLQAVGWAAVTETLLGNSSLARLAATPNLTLACSGPTLPPGCVPPACPACPAILVLALCSVIAAVIATVVILHRAGRLDRLL